MLALVIVLVPLLAACSSPAPATNTPAPTVTTATSPAASAKPTTTSSTLKVGFSICYTGPAAEKGRPMGNAKLDAMKYINAELGGVLGNKIEVIWRDSEYDTAKSVTILNELMEKGALLFTTNDSKTMGASMEIANRANFPGIAVFASTSQTHPPKHIYAQMPDYGDDWAVFARYYLDNIWKDKSRKPKMALHLLNNPTGYGARDAAKALAEQMGIEIIDTAEHAATTISEVESLTRIKALKPDVIYISSTPQPTSIIIKNAAELGLLPGVTIGLGHASITSKLVELAGADKLEGVYGVYPTVNWGDNVPAMAKMTEYVKKYHPEDYGNMDYITSWAEGLTIAEIFKLAIQNAGGVDKLTPQIVEEQGIKKLNKFDVGGLHGPVTYVPGDNRLAKAVRVFQIKGGKITPISEWIDAPLIKYEEFSWFK